MNQPHAPVAGGRPMPWWFVAAAGAMLAVPTALLALRLLERP